MSNERQEAGKVWTEWFDRPSSRRAMWRALWAACLITVFAEWALERKGHFGIDAKFGFYAVLGFAACAVMILAAKGLGFFLKRGENFYGEAEAGAGTPAAGQREGGVGDG